MADDIEDDGPMEFFDGDTEQAYVGQVELPELRRLVALQAAHRFGSSPEKAVKIAGDFERFLMGNSLKVVKSNE